MLVQSALDAVRQWRYKPYILNGEPVEVETQVDVNFNADRRLKKNAPTAGGRE